MKIPRKYYALNYIARLFANFQDESFTDCPKISFSEVHDLKDNPLPIKKTYELNLSASALSKMLHLLTDNKMCCLDGLAIAKDDCILFSGYRYPFSKKYPRITNSMCKTVTAIAIMFAVSERRLSLEDSVLSFFPEYETIFTSKYIKQMTIEHLLTMTSCSKCTEITTLVEEDWVKAFLLSDCYYEPGSQFMYNSMNTYMLSAILCKITKTSLMEYMRPRLFVPLGISPVLWELCPKGIERGGWGMHLSLDGMLKIGVFLVNDGRYKDVQLISSSYIQKMKKVKVEQNIDSLATGYGYQMWHLPNGCYMLSGMFGQHVIIDDNNKLVIATNAHNDCLFPDSTLTQIILECINDKKLYHLDKKVANEINYQLLKKEFQIFCEGKNIPKKIKDFIKLSFRNYRNCEENQSEKKFVKLKETCMVFSGKKLHITNDNFHLFPYMMIAMYKIQPFIITDIAFDLMDDFFCLSFLKDNKEENNKSNEKIIIKAGLNNYQYQIIQIGPNCMQVAAKTAYSRDENDYDVLLLDITFPITGFSRIIKFFLIRDKVSLECTECPNLKEIATQLLNGDLTLFESAITLFEKIPKDFLLFIENKIEPSLITKLQDNQ